MGILALTVLGAEPAPAFLGWAERPPMGWNSWDCFATTVTEAQAKAQTDYMAEHLARYGWQFVVVDIQWYEPKATGFDYRKNAELIMDDMGRLWPATNRFPSAANGAGFKPLSDYVHSKGLKFGVHLLRGIPRQAVNRNTRVSDTPLHARDIADTNSACAWNSDMFGIDMKLPAAQEYYNSVIELFTSWGVDFVKVDDISRPYHKAEIEAIRHAIDAVGHAMVLSLSPGETPLSEGDHVAAHANLWRISDDFWDNWDALREQFDRLRDWTPHRGPGHFPDADMLPLGVVGMGRATHFSRDEQYTLMTLWSIARSPLIFGGDMTKMDDFTLSLLTNVEVLAVNQRSANNHEFFNRQGLIGWVADPEDSTDRYVALFNTRNGKTNEPATSVPLDFAQIGLAENCSVRDLWSQTEQGKFKTRYHPEIRPHGAALYRITGQKLTAPPRATQDTEVPETCYLFSYFIGNGEDGLHLAWSRDGYKWDDLNGGRSLLTPHVGESRLMRDPCLHRGPDGVFRLVWTASWNSRIIGYASSKDLVNWSDQQAIAVMPGEPATLNCWAPEIAWNPKKQNFIILWASTVTNKFTETAGQSEDHYNHRIYCTTTKDFRTFSPTRLYYDPGFSVIDATLLPAQDRYYLIFKDETLIPPRKFLRIAVADDPEGPFGPPGPAFTPAWVEGPTTLRLGGEFIVYFDCYRARRYGAMKSKDLVHWEDATDRLSMPLGARHGSALPVPGSVISALLKNDP